MRDDWDIDAILTGITSGILDDLAKIVARQESLTFPAFIEQKHPEHSDRLIEKGDMVSLIKTFHSFANYCGHVPELAHKQVFLQRQKHPDYEWGLIPFDSGQHYDELHSPHSAAIIMIGEAGGLHKPYLVDPTFRQFCENVDDSLLKPGETPAYRLARLNPDMCEKLTTRGFCRLTPDNAEDYVQCFRIEDPNYEPQPQAFMRILTPQS